MPTKRVEGPSPAGRIQWLVLALLMVTLVLLFCRSFGPGTVLFANDSPFGAGASEHRQGLTVMEGRWNPLNWAGFSEGSAFPGITGLFRWVAGSTLFYKFYVPFTLMFLALSAWLFFKRLKFSPVACWLGALAAMLNSDFLSTSCWGVGSQTITHGLGFLALAAIAGGRSAPNRILRTVLAGSAVGLGLVEGADIGAILSVFVAAFIVWQALAEGEGPLVKRAVGGFIQTSIVAVVSAIVAFHTINTLVGTQIKGVAGATAEERTTQERWDWATQWSLPKKEVISMAVPGLFGYRMDTPNGGSYWGQVGRTPGWEEHRQGPPRFIGGGFYAGILVVVVAVWALAQSFRKRGSVFSDPDRKWIWFWGGVCVVSVLLAFGRYAPFYQLVYSLPFFSTIRNPVKFVHVLNWAIVVLFAYGVNGLIKGYASRAKQTVSGGSWWKRLSSFDRKWVTTSGAAFFGACVTWLIYASSKADLEAFLVKEAIDPALAPSVARFSISSVGAFVLLLGIALTLVTLVLAGFFRGSRSTWAGVVLGLFLLFDLGRASQPWIVHVNYKQKYATNPVIDFLREKPYEQRVAGLPFPTPNEFSLLGQLYRIEWHQHHFPYYNIQSLDIVQMPRMPEEIAAFETAFRPDSTKPETVARVLRRWELTNTRYLLGPAGFVDALNTQLDGGRGRFRIAMAFDVVPRPGVANASKLEDFTAVPSPAGRYAVIEFAGALPRASLYTGWQVETNNATTLEQLASPDFNPVETLLVASEVEASSSGETNVSAGAVEFVSYAPKHVVLEASNTVPSILLLNDKYDPNWKLTLDGQPATLLRCNSVMRGVFLEPGEHSVEMRFEPPVRGLYVTVIAMGVSLLLLGVLVVSGSRNRKAPHTDPKRGASKAPSDDPGTPRKA